MDIREVFTILKRRDPFTPVRIHMVDGAHYDVTRREQSLVSEQWVHVGRSRSGKPPYDRVERVAVCYIDRIEPLATSRTARSRRRRR